MTPISSYLPALSNGEYHVFVSYCSNDRTFAVELVRQLEGAGFHVFYDETELLPGQDLALRLRQSLAKSRSALLLISRSSLKSSWCREEWNISLNRRVTDSNFKAIPVRLDDCDFSTFESIHYVDFSGKSLPEGPKVNKLLYALIGQPVPHSEIPSATDRLTRPRRFRKAAYLVGGMAAFALLIRTIMIFLPAAPCEMKEGRYDEFKIQGVTLPEKVWSAKGNWPVVPGSVDGALATKGEGYAVRKLSGTFYDGTFEFTIEPETGDTGWLLRARLESDGTLSGYKFVLYPTPKQLMFEAFVYERGKMVRMLTAEPEEIGITQYEPHDKVIVTSSASNFVFTHKFQLLSGDDKADTRKPHTVADVSDEESTFRWGSVGFVGDDKSQFRVENLSVVPLPVDLPRNGSSPKRCVL